MSGTDELKAKIIRQIENRLENRPDYLFGYFSYLRSNGYTPRTIQSYINEVIRFTETTGNKVKEYSFEDFSNYIAGLEYNLEGNPTTASYRIMAYSAIKKFCNYLYASDRIEKNYMDSIAKPKFFETKKTIEKRNSSYLTKEEVQKCLDNIEDLKTHSSRMYRNYWIYRDELIFWIFLCTGIRRSALVGLDVNDVDLSKKCIVVFEKGQKTREVKLPRKVFNMAKNWIELRNELIESKRVKNVDSEALFITTFGTRLTGDWIQTILYNITFNIEKDVTPHKLRATFGTQLYNETKDILFVQKVMGHVSTETTKLYVRDDNDESKKAANIMGKMFT